MNEENGKEPVEHATTEEPEVSALLENDLEDVAGGGTFGDIYDALNESWTDIKKGFMDAWND